MRTRRKQQEAETRNLFGQVNELRWLIASQDQLMADLESRLEAQSKDLADVETRTDLNQAQCERDAEYLALHWHESRSSYPISAEDGVSPVVWPDSYEKEVE